MSDRRQKRLAVYVEGQNDKDFLETLIPRLTGMTIHGIEIVVFRGWSKLKANAAPEMRTQQHHCSRFIVIADEDKSTCAERKQCITADLQRHHIDDGIYDVVIACNAMESFFLGDLTSVEKALNLDGLTAYQQSNPDSLRDPKPKKVFNELIFKHRGKPFKPRQEASAIAEHINITGGNRSASFNHLCNTIRAVA